MSGHILSITTSCEVVITTLYHNVIIDFYSLILTQKVTLRILTIKKDTLCEILLDLTLLRWLKRVNSWFVIKDGVTEPFVGSLCIVHIESFCCKETGTWSTRSNIRMSIILKLINSYTYSNMWFCFDQSNVTGI